ncbi:hypothetical protein KC717_05165, partial [Candidatus Dojkabacteria bacterium]|nr:hypothetical protein [Candidatus Dojkabacteria bacterium]
AIALMFAVSKKIIESHMSILNGAWKPTEIVGSELSGKNLYVIGNGNIGKKIQGLGAALNMNVSYADSKTSESEIDEQLMQADFICLALPLNNQTEGMIHAKRLEIMKDTAILINVARGLIIDQDDLYTALKEGTIAGAGLDVFPDDSTITEPGEGILRFAQLKNVVTTPHNAYNSQETMSRLGSELLADLESCIQSKPINVVN